MEPEHRTVNARAGFTLVELMFVLIAVVPLLGAVFATGSMTKSEIHAIDQAATVAESCRLTGQRMAILARPALLSTIQVKANAADVAAAQQLALTFPSTYIPTIGEWISPPPGFSRDNISFQAADGELSMNASRTTPVQQFEFAMDSNETANGLDDDGDGLIDEGKLFLRDGSTQVQVTNGVERCLFSINDRLLKIDLTCARCDNQGRVYRAASSQHIYFRNN